MSDLWLRLLIASLRDLIPWFAAYAVVNDQTAYEMNFK
jgi:hypothetical protein